MTNSGALVYCFSKDSSPEDITDHNWKVARNTVDRITTRCCNEKKAKIHWSHHVCARTVSHKTAFDWVPTRGRKKRGRSKTTWCKALKENLRLMNRNLADI